MYEFMVPCLFGLEGPTAEQLRRMGCEKVRAENGHVRFAGSDADCARANLRLRTGERVLLQLGRFPARSFEELFQGVKALPLAELIPRDGQFPVKGYCLQSALHSVPDCQKIIKKAAAACLGEAYHLRWLPETGSLYQIQFSLVKDEAEIFLDTTGAPLYKRGYRLAHGVAPLRETLAAALVGFSRYRGKDAFWDPFCGSGTIAIEAALIARNRAPGLQRTFAAQAWAGMPARVWQQAAEEARSLEYPGPYAIFASDIDPQAVALAKDNARRAGVEEDIRFSVADACTAKAPGPAGVVVGNPPYGERMGERQQAQQLYRRMGQTLGKLPGWEKYLLSSEPDFERWYGFPAVKRRKLYNGMILCQLFVYK